MFNLIELLAVREELGKQQMDLEQSRNQHINRLNDDLAIDVDILDTSSKFVFKRVQILFT